MAKPAPSTPLYLVVSEGLARAAELECGPGRHDYFVLLGLSPRQASPEDVRVAVPALIRTLRDVLYDRELGREARELKKELQRIGEALATARDIADYRREIEAVPQREQMLLLRRFEEEARRAFEEAREPSGGLMETLRSRSRDLKLNQPHAEALLNRLWDEFAPVPFDREQVADKPKRLVDESPEFGPGGRPPRPGEKAAPKADKKKELNWPRDREEAFPPQRQSDIRPLAAQLFAKPGTAGKAPPPPPVENKGDADPGNISFGGFPTNLSEGVKPLDPGMFDFGFGPAPLQPPPSKPFTSPSSLDIPMPGTGLLAPPASAAPIIAPPSPAAGAIPLPVIPPIAPTSPPPLPVAPPPLGQALLGHKPPSSRKYGKGKGASKGDGEGGAAKRSDGGPPVVTPAWREAAAIEHPAGTSDRRLRRVDTLSWRGYFPVHKLSHKESRALLARAQEVIGRPMVATPSMEAAAPTALMEAPFSAAATPSGERARAAEEPTMAMPHDQLAAAAAALEGGPRAVSNKRPRGVAGDAVDIESMDFSGPFAKKPGEGEAWQDHSKTPDYSSTLADIERTFMDAVFRAAGKKGLTSKKRNELVQAANDYGLTMARAIQLIDQRFPTDEHVGDVTHLALKGSVGRAGLGDAAPAVGFPAHLPTEAIIGMAEEVERSRAAQFIEAFRRQIVPIVRDILFSWPVLILAVCSIAYFGLNMVLWLATDSMKAKPPAATSDGAAPLAAATAPGPPNPPPGPDYLGQPLPAGAETKPDELIPLRARFIDGGTYVAAFSMRKCEVTVAEYAEFVEATGREPPPVWGGRTPLAGTETFPVVGVTLADARAYCEWRSLRDRLANRRYMIPSERQYRACVRDVQGATLEQAVVGTRRPNPASVGAGDTVEVDGAAIHHLLGNVSEWTTREVDQSDGLFGASWREKLDARAATTARLPSEPRSDAVGFRYALIDVP